MDSPLPCHKPAWDEGTAPSLALEMTRLVPRWICSAPEAPTWCGVRARQPLRAGTREKHFWEACGPHGPR